MTDRGDHLRAEFAQKSIWSENSVEKGGDFIWIDGQSKKI